jgi:predicted nucleotidyltransferase
MHTLIEDRLPDIADLCRRHDVRRLEVFGSAAVDGAFDPESSDVDFLVDFDGEPGERYSARYFGLMEDLKALLGRDVDLVSDRSIRNPYFRASVDRSRRLVFAA